jgi:SpoVK/Ycf46/Vps4 family AAA+-type ATPase
MFLTELDTVISRRIQQLILNKYTEVRTMPVPDRENWNKIADADVECHGTARKTVKGVLEEEFLDPLSGLSADSRRAIDGRRSALLFGPPGTAKTTIVRELARAIGWPCVEIRPSHFLKASLEHIYESADEIFIDLVDLSRTVIFFDEMDALVQSRTAPLDVTRQFLTTSMLPKLAELHDQGRVVFFVATNYRATFDQAVIRPGRFDLLLFVGPPSCEEKLRCLQAMVKGNSLAKDVPPAEIKAAVEVMRTQLGSWIIANKLLDQVQLFTFGEMKSLVEQLLKLTKETSLSAAAAKLDEAAFVAAVKDWSTNYIILREPSEEKTGEIKLVQAAKNWLQTNSAARGKTEYANYLHDKSTSRLQ